MTTTTLGEVWPDPKAFFRKVMPTGAPLYPPPLLPWLSDLQLHKYMNSRLAFYADKLVDVKCVLDITTSDCIFSSYWYLTQTLHAKGDVVAAGEDPGVQSRLMNLHNKLLRLRDHIHITYQRIVENHSRIGGDEDFDPERMETVLYVPFHCDLGFMERFLGDDYDRRGDKRNHWALVVINLNTRGYNYSTSQ